MPPTKPFNTLVEVRAEKERLRRERDRVQAGLKVQLALVRDPEFRRALAGDAFGDMLQAWRPLRSVKKLLGNSPALTSSALGLLFGSKAKAPLGRVLIAVATAALPLIMERMGRRSGATSDNLFSELAVSWGRVKEYVRERRAARSSRP
ncbi:MAG TPA: hypothetical protein VKG92_04775 [Flavobacteriales bacterium]|nr:hypothetical protein [Flavobacteriales bacterium]